MACSRPRICVSKLELRLAMLLLPCTLLNSSSAFRPIAGASVRTHHWTRSESTMRTRPALKSLMSPNASASTSRSPVLADHWMDALIGRLCCETPPSADATTHNMKQKRAHVIDVSRSARLNLTSQYVPVSRINRELPVGLRDTRSERVLAWSQLYTTCPSSAPLSDGITKRGKRVGASPAENFNTCPRVLWFSRTPATVSAST